MRFGYTTTYLDVEIVSVGHRGCVEYSAGPMGEKFTEHQFSALV